MRTVPTVFRPPAPRHVAAALLLAATGLICTASATGPEGVTVPATAPAAARSPLDPDRPNGTDRPDSPDGTRGPALGSGARCRTDVQGSRVTAQCHNPYPDTDRVQLHIECDRWWDPDVDSAPAEVGPAQRVELSGRCWLGIRQAWVSHTPPS
ncbi:hypothetical protein [Streptomyces sp. URMC 123]|uniref:hypothetical protein n=1 Tax=Streptomyces sp. URMC 123 TaxID=3423403 RepID=UPI003F1C8E72